MNKESSDTGNIGHKTQNEDKQNKINKTNKQKYKLKTTQHRKLK